MKPIRGLASILSLALFLAAGLAMPSAGAAQAGASGARAADVIAQEGMFWGSEVPEGWAGEWPTELLTVAEKSDFTRTMTTRDLYELIDQRYRSGSMIVTANRSPKDWYPLFPNPVIAESALDRLLICSHTITLTGRSYRSLLRPDKALEKEVITV